mgnify:CR=1 FL=1
MKTSGTIIIVGGGVVGSSIAYHLRRDGHDGPLLVIERDPTYARASSALETVAAPVTMPTERASPAREARAVRVCFTWRLRSCGPGDPERPTG